MPLLVLDTERNYKAMPIWYQEILMESWIYKRNTIKITMQLQEQQPQLPLVLEDQKIFYAKTLTSTPGMEHLALFHTIHLES